MNQIAGVLFDKDGVLVDFHATWGPATARTIRHVADDEAQAQVLARAIEFDLDAMLFSPTSPFIAGTSEDTVRAWTPIVGSDAALWRRIGLSMMEHGAACVAAPPEVPVALRALRSAGLPLGIATNDQEESARLQMAKLELFDLFETISGSDSGYGAKPGPGMIEAFAVHLNAPPARIVMVGDSTHDLHAARAAGAIAVAIGTGPATLESLAPHADHTIETMAGLPPLVSALNQGS